MVFKRRRPRTMLQFVADGFYPKGGWARAFSYIMHRLRRLPDPPRKVARGIAAGVFVCFTPFYGFHFLTAALAAFLIRGNILAALLATFAGNPLTFPFIATVCIEIGNRLLGVAGGVPLPEVFGGFSRASLELWYNFMAVFTSESARWENLLAFYGRVFLPYLAGGILPGAIAAVVSYMLALPAVRAYQARRAKRFRKRLLKRRAAAAAGRRSEAGPTG